MLPCLCNAGIEASIWTLKTESEGAACGLPALARYRSSASAGVNCWAAHSIGNTSDSNAATTIAAVSDGNTICEKRTSGPRSHRRSANDRAIAFWRPLQNPFDFNLATELPCQSGGICQPKCRPSAIVIIGLRAVPASGGAIAARSSRPKAPAQTTRPGDLRATVSYRSEEHTSELQSL